METVPSTRRFDDGRCSLAVKRVNYPLMRAKNSPIVHIVTGAHLYWGGRWGDLYVGYHRLCGGVPFVNPILLNEVPKTMRFCRVCHRKFS